MGKKAYIEVKGEIIECRISPKILERDYRKKHKVFRTNGRRLLKKLARAYGLTYRIGFQRIKHFNYKVRCIVRIEGLIDITIGLGQTNRDAMKNAVFQAHRNYCKKIIYKNE